MSRFLRTIGLQSKLDPKSYKRFKDHPKSETTYLLYRGDTRDPAMIKQAGGFSPQRGQRHNVSSGDTAAGASTGMVCLTLDPSVAGTYYAYVKNYYGNPTWGSSNQASKQGFVYVVVLPTGRGILNYKLAEQYGSNNAGSREVSSLVVPWAHVLGWRQLPSPDKCKPPIGTSAWNVNYVGAFVQNPDLSVELEGLSSEAREYLSQFTGFPDLTIYNNKAL